MNRRLAAKSSAAKRGDVREKLWHRRTALYV